MLLEKLGDNIRFYREQLNLTQQELADQINVSRSVLTKWENANLVPDIGSLLKLSRIFDVNLDELVGNQKNSIIRELNNRYDLNHLVDAEMVEIIHYLSRNVELKEGVYALSQLSRKSRKPIEEIMKVMLRELLS